MDPARDNQFEYVEGQLRPSHPALLESFARLSEAAASEAGAVLGVRYGPHPRQVLDLFRAMGKRRATIAYFHAGYWQSRDKAQFRFLAPPLVAADFDVALVNYPLSPESAVPDIVTAAAAALPILSEPGEDAPLILVGHSAGAHIAVELAVARPTDRPVSGVVAISGVFDLEPLVYTSLNERLALGSAAARAASPLHRVAANAPPAIFAVGALETGAFRNQTAAMAKAWRDAGNKAREMIVPGADHFSILPELCRDGGVLRAGLEELAPARC